MRASSINRTLICALTRALRICGNSVVGEGRVGNGGDGALRHVAADTVVGRTCRQSLFAAESAALLVVTFQTTRTVKIKRHLSGRLQVWIVS